VSPVPVHPLFVKVLHGEYEQTPAVHTPGAKEPAGGVAQSGLAVQPVLHVYLVKSDLSQNLPVPQSASAWQSEYLHTLLSQVAGAMPPVQSLRLLQPTLHMNWSTFDLSQNVLRSAQSVSAMHSEYTQLPARHCLGAPKNGSLQSSFVAQPDLHSLVPLPSVSVQMLPSSQVLGLAVQV
jgi:hypothetical protein